MKERILTSLLTVFVITGLQAQTGPAVPRLVVGLTIDQLRADYIEAFFCFIWRARLQASAERRAHLYGCGI